MGNMYSVAIQRHNRSQPSRHRDDQYQLAKDTLPAQKMLSEPSICHSLLCRGVSPPCPSIEAGKGRLTRRVDVQD